MLDPIEVLTHPENITPFFQPIYGADTHDVVAFEVLAHYVTEQGPISLKSFFEDGQVPDDYVLEVERKVCELALLKAEKFTGEEKIILHKNPDSLLSDTEDSFLSMLKKSNVALHRFIIAIKLNAFQGDTEGLGHLCRYYRTYGIRFAVEHAGGFASGVDRMSKIFPDIIKVDLQPLRHMQNTNHIQEVYQTLALLARKIGASLMYHNIETLYQLKYAWANGGRYYQGAFLQKPVLVVEDIVSVKQKLRNDIHSFILHEKQTLERSYDSRLYFEKDIQQLLSKYSFSTSTIDNWLANVVNKTERYAFRMYVCDADGFQLSSNFYRQESDWQVDEQYKGKNWSWRPYFLATILKMSRDERGELSDLYSDLSSGMMIRTFSYPLESDAYLFVDISYDFLYENDLL